MGRRRREGTGQKSRYAQVDEPIGGADAEQQRRHRSCQEQRADDAEADAHGGHGSGLPEHQRQHLTSVAPERHAHADSRVLWRHNGRLTP